MTIEGTKEDKHAYYGPCDGFDNGECAKCVTVICALRAVALAARELVTALDNVIACSDDEHPSRYAPLEAREALRLKLKEIGL